MFLFLKMIFILKLHAHTEWHIVDSVDNVLYCQFDCCWFCVFVLGFLCFGGVFLVFIFGFGFVVVGVLFLCLGFFSLHATAVLLNGVREYSICFHCLE